MASDLDRADVIVVGAGSAGAVLAARLSEDPSVKVLLLEAGGGDASPFFQIPILVAMALRYQFGDWGYSTEPEPGFAGRVTPMPRGKVLGGRPRSMACNGCAAARPTMTAGPRPACRAGTGTQALAGFRRLERFEDGASEMHGADGQVPIHSGGVAAIWKLLYDAFIAAGAEAGYPVTRDFNAPPFEGVGPNYFNIEGGRRWSTARAFLKPARSRPNLRIVTGAQAA